jgi:hypothetical protein
MNATEMGRRSDSLYYDNVSRRELCDRIAHLESDLEDAKGKDAKLREFAAEAWELLTCNEPNFVWSGLQKKASELGIEVD